MRPPGRSSQERSAGRSTGSLRGDTLPLLDRDHLLLPVSAHQVTPVLLVGVTGSVTLLPVLSLTRMGRSEIACHGEKLSHEDEKNRRDVFTFIIFRKFVR